MSKACSLSTPTPHPQLVSLACSRLPFAVTPLFCFHQLLPHSIYNPTSHCGAAYYCNILGFTRPTFCNAASSWPAALGSVPWVVAVCWVLLPGNVMVTMMWPSCFAPAQSNPLLLASQNCEHMCVIPYLRTTMGPHHVVLRAAPRSF